MHVINPRVLQCWGKFVRRLLLFEVTFSHNALAQWGRLVNRWLIGRKWQMRWSSLGQTLREVKGLGILIQKPAPRRPAPRR